MINWLRKTAAQALDLAAEAYGALAGWCIHASEQLDPYGENDYRIARKVIADAAKAIAEDDKPAWNWEPNWNGTSNPFPRAELRDVDPADFWFSDRPITRTTGFDRETESNPLDGVANTWKTDWPREWDSQPYLSPEELAHVLSGGHYPMKGGCSCGWPTGVHPSEVGDE